MKTNNIEGYIKEKIKEYLSTSSTFFQRIQSDTGALSLIRDEIKKIKADKGEKGFTEVKGKLVKLQEIHYNMFLLDQSNKQLQGSIYEYATICKLFGIELDIPEGAKEYFDTVASISPHIFAVEQGQPVLVQNDVTTPLMQALQTKMESEEALKAIYKSL